MDLIKLLGNIENKEEVINKINAEIGREFVPRSEFNAKNEELKKTTQALTERDGQIETLSATAGDKDALTAEINRLKTESKNEAKKFSENMKKVRIQSAIEREIAGLVNADAIDLIPNLIKHDSITLNDDGSIFGLKEQIESLRENRKSLFKSDEQDTNKPQFVKGQTTTPKPTLTREAVEAIKNPIERRQAIADNIALYK